MNEDNVFSKIDNEEKIDETFRNVSSEENTDKIHDNNKFITGLPDWDLVPPNEVVRRSQL